MPNNQVPHSTQGMYTKKAGRGKAGKGVLGSTRTGKGAVAITGTTGNGASIAGIAKARSAAANSGTNTTDLEASGEPGMFNPVAQKIRKGGNKKIRNLSNNYKVVP